MAAQLTEGERLHYANTLVLTAKQAYAPKAGVLATGMTMTGKRLKRRIEAIVHMRAVQRVAASLVAVVLFPEDRSAIDQCTYRISLSDTRTWSIKA